MVIGEVGLVGLAVVLLVEVAHIPERKNAITQAQQTAETTVLDLLLIPRSATIMNAQVSHCKYNVMFHILLY